MQVVVLILSLVLMNTGVNVMEEVSWFECDNGRDMAYSYAWSMLQLGYRTTVIRSGGVYGVKVQDITVH